MSTEEEDWLDEALLEDDPPSKRGWARRSLNGLSVNDALSAVPRRGQLLVEAPIELFRALQAHIVSRGMTQSQWVRQAIGMRLHAEGHPDAEWWLQ